MFVCVVGIKGKDLRQVTGEIRLLAPLYYVADNWLTSMTSLASGYSAWAIHMHEDFDYGPCRFASYAPVEPPPAKRNRKKYVREEVEFDPKHIGAVPPPVSPEEGLTWNFEQGLPDSR